MAAQDAAPADGGGEGDKAAEGGNTEGGGEVGGSTRPPLTGNPQIDYKFDPNLPHELIGYDLSDYPFYNKLPKDLLDPKFNFTCDGRHDGFYASIPHKCQVRRRCRSEGMDEKSDTISARAFEKAFINVGDSGGGL